jgi:hypothetical protein
VTVTPIDDVITLSASHLMPRARRRSSFSGASPPRFRWSSSGSGIDEVKRDRIAGSSGTPQGFNAARERINEQARMGRTTPK